MKPLLSVVSFLALISMCASGTFAKTWLIKPDGTGDAPTIQAGIDSAGVGDVVSLADGTYIGDGNRAISFMGKTITVRSQSGNPDICVIDCGGLERGLAFQTGEGPGSVLNGVTIKNGNEFFGGAILCFFSSPTISNCAFIGNNAVQGGGMFCSTFSTPSITNCTFSENYAQFGGGFLCSESSTIAVVRTIITFSQRGGATFCDGTSGAVLSCCDVFGNTGDDWAGCLDGQLGINGNFEADPEYCGIIGSGYLYLQSGSPCAPGNHPQGDSCGLIGALPVNCVVATEDKTWGEIKAIYKDNR